jgi:hypothetical protein
MIDPHTREIIEADGFQGLAFEASALLRRMTAAHALYRDGRVKAVLAATDGIAARVAEAKGSSDPERLTPIVDEMRERVRAARRLANPDGLAALVLHADEAEWVRYPSLSAYLRENTPGT